MICGLRYQTNAYNPPLLGLGYHFIRSVFKWFTTVYFWFTFTKLKYKHK